MKNLSTIMFFSLLVQACITVPRIQKKDTRNNGFSTELQNWFYVAHPQKIDTQTKVKSDTTFQYYLDSTYQIDSVEYDSTFQAKLDALSKCDGFKSNLFSDIVLTTNSIFSWGRNKSSILPNNGGMILIGDSLVHPISLGLYSSGTGHWSKGPTNKIITIHDSIFTKLVDLSQVDALNNQLKLSRDSLTTSTLLVATTKNESLKRLIAAIIASIVALILLILFLKKSIL